MAKHKGDRKGPPPKKAPLTHFLCIPLINPASRPLLEASINEFRNLTSKPIEEVRDRSTQTTGAGQENNLATIHPKAVRPAGTLHLTIGVMSLDEQKLSEAAEYLKGDDVRNLLNITMAGSSETMDAEPLSTTIEDTPSLERHAMPPTRNRNARPLEIQLKGLESMHPVHKTSVLYSAPEDKTARLYPLCQALEKLFKTKGFLIDQNRSLILHATLVNTVYAKGRKGPAKRILNDDGLDSNHKASTSAGHNVEFVQASQSVDRGGVKSHGHGPNADAPLRMDATAVLEAYKDFVWTENVVLDRLAICKMGAKKLLDEEGNVVDEEYEEVATVLFPD